MKTNPTQQDFLEHLATLQSLSARRQRAVLKFAQGMARESAAQAAADAKLTRWQLTQAAPAVRHLKLVVDNGPRP